MSQQVEVSVRQADTGSNSVPVLGLGPLSKNPRVALTILSQWVGYHPTR